MHAPVRRWPAWLLAGLVAMGLTNAVRAEADDKPAAGPTDRQALNKQLFDTLKDIHNRGADIYNKGNPDACYYLFLGALQAVKPLVTTDLQQDITNGLANAERNSDISRRAFALHETIEAVRGKLNAGAKTAKAPDGKKPDDKTAKKPDDTKVDDKKPAKKPDDAKVENKKPTQPSLWERLGGEANVKKVVDDFVDLAAADPKVNLTRNGKFKLDEGKVALLKKELIDFVSSATGGPYKYTGRSMKEAHQGMGITDAEFNATAADLKKALEKNGAKPADVDLVLEAVGGTRKDIVEKKPDGKKPDDKKGGDSKLDDKKPGDKTGDKPVDKKLDDKKEDKSKE